MGGGIPSAEHDEATKLDPGKRRLRMAIDATAGALAGCISRFIVGPLDVIKIRFQVQLEPIAGNVARSKYTGFGQAFVTIFKEEGIQGLWRGTVPGLLLTIPYTAVQFVAHSQVKEQAERWGLTKHPSLAPVVSLGSGALAGAAGTVASYPFDLLRTTMAAQGEPKVYKNMWHAVQRITAERGVAGLYSGLGVTVLEIMPYAALQFGMYDYLKSSWKTARERDIATRQQSGIHSTTSVPFWHGDQFGNFSAGLVAGLFAKLTTHPLDVAKKRYQVAGLPRSLKYGARVKPKFAMQSLASSLFAIYRNEGVAGLWKGSIPSIVKAAPAAAITFTAYEWVLNGILVAVQQYNTAQQQERQQGANSKAASLQQATTPLDTSSSRNSKGGVLTSHADDGPAKK